MLLQAFEGSVLKVGDDSFVARLIDRSNDMGDQEAEFPMDEVSDSDRPLIVPGAIFYWDIGYLENKGGQRHRTSMIQFRRLPSWTAKEIQKSKDQAKIIRDKIDWR